MLYYLFLKIINIFTGLDAVGSHMTCLDVCMHKQHIICTKTWTLAYIFLSR